jgi:hypothetical protein
MKLTIEEKESLLSLVKRFSGFSNDLDTCANRLEEIEAERESLMHTVIKLQTEVESIREEENQFTAMLTTKYGEFRLDMETFEIQPS